MKYAQKYSDNVRIKWIEIWLNRETIAMTINSYCYENYQHLDPSSFLNEDYSMIFEMFMK